MQQTIKALVDARRQVRYRRMLLSEAERDLKNKTADLEIAKAAAEAALDNMLNACDEVNR